MRGTDGAAPAIEQERVMDFDWKDNGFLAAPSPRPATGRERLYRAWGGDPQRKRGNTERPGVCFSLDKATSRWEAERLYAVMEYRNPVLYLTEFAIPKDTPIWVGRVDPGDARALLGEVSGNQVFVERAYMDRITEVATTALRNDLRGAFVSTGRQPATA